MKLDDLKNKLTAAVAMSAAALIASGYLITWVRLANVGAPSRAVLPALSTTYYLGVALESLLLLLLVLVLVGGTFLLAQIAKLTRARTRVKEGAKEASARPSLPAWLALGAGIASVGLIVAGWPVSVLLTSHTHSAYLPAMFGFGLLVVVLSWGAWSAGEALGLLGGTWVAAAILLLATLAAIGFKLLEAGLGPVPFPEAVVWVPKADCHTPDAIDGPDGCAFSGFYVGDDNSWIYLVQTPLNCKGSPHFPSRLTLVPRDKAIDMVVSEKLRSSEPVCPETAQEKAEREHESTNQPNNNESVNKNQREQANGKANENGQSKSNKTPSKKKRGNEHKGSYKGSQDQLSTSVMTIERQRRATRPSTTSRGS